MRLIAYCQGQEMCVQERERDREEREAPPMPIFPFLLCGRSCLSPHSGFPYLFRRECMPLTPFPPIIHTHTHTNQNKQESFEHIQDWLNEVNRYASEGTCKLLVGNKSDRHDKVVSTEKAKVRLSCSFSFPQTHFLFSVFCTMTTRTHPLIYFFFLPNRNLRTSWAFLSSRPRRRMHPMWRRHS